MDGVNNFNQFVVLHKFQLESSDIPKHLWKSLCYKLATETFDAGAAFQLMLIEYDENVQEEQRSRPAFALSVIKENGIRANDPTAIYLIDHAWTFRTQSARRDLEQHENLLNRMCAITGVDLDNDCRVDEVLKRIWRYCHSYRLASAGLNDEEQQPIWYVMDEVGSAVNHANDPNFRIVPFLHLDTCTTYSLLFPINDCVYGDLATRDYMEYVSKSAREREVLLLPWQFTDFTAFSFIQAEPQAEYFTSGHMPETYPREEVKHLQPLTRYNAPLKVYAEYEVVVNNLTSPSFMLVEDREEADVFWLTEHFKDFENFASNRSNKFINQFPGEYVITIKDLLSIVCRRAAVEHHNAETLETYPSWLPTTYNLKTELIEFASYYQNRAKRGLNNHWIVKPWNLARGLDTHITASIEHIVRLPTTGPKIAQKYIERPVLFYRSLLNAHVKFDIRYILLLKSVKPLEAYIYRKFFLRFANKEFSLNQFDDYEKHFTVMNYQNDATLHHVTCDEFLNLWLKQYPNFPWYEVEEKICKMLYDMLECATNTASPCGLVPCAQSRAMYAADIMLEWYGMDDNATKMQPKLLEVNWTPDCKRACDYYPDFFNDIFTLLFLNQINDKLFRLLSKN